jgi:hypothetical protein
MSDVPTSTATMCPQVEALQAEVKTKQNTVIGLAVGLGCAVAAFVALWWDWRKKKGELEPRGVEAAPAPLQVNGNENGNGNVNGNVIGAIFGPRRATPSIRLQQMPAHTRRQSG